MNDKVEVVSGDTILFSGARPGSSGQGNSGKGRGRKSSGGKKKISRAAVGAKRREGYRANMTPAEKRADAEAAVGRIVASPGFKQAMATFEREHEMSLANNTRDMLVQAEHALARIENGTYGICENCGNPIGKARLQVFPRATLCMTCKQREERR